MARIRAIKPEFFSSPGVNSADPNARLLFIAMWCWADDNGVGTANPRELLAFAFPLDEEITVVDLRRWLVEITRVFGVMFYSVAGRAYYSIPSWEKHQKFDRRSKGKYPGPDEADHAEIPANKGQKAHSTESHESTSSQQRDSVAGTGEEGTGEQFSSSEPAGSDKADPPRPDVQEIIDYLSAALERNDVRFKVGKSWHDEGMRLIDIDKYTVHQIKVVIRYATTDQFWKTNVLSMPTLRVKFEQLKIKAQAMNNQAPAQVASQHGWAN